MSTQDWLVVSREGRLGCYFAGYELNVQAMSDVDFQEPF